MTSLRWSTSVWPTTLAPTSGPARGSLLVHGLTGTGGDRPVRRSGFMGHDMSLAANQTEPGAHGRIPVLDIGAYLAGETGAAAPLARAIARTCEDTGFLVVANHG